METQAVVSRHDNPPERMPIVRMLKQTSLEWYQSRTFEHGAALAFYAIFSIAPVMVLAFTAASLVLGSEAAQGRLTQELESTVGRTVAGAIQATAQYTYRSGSGVPATILSIAFFGFGATGLFSQLQSAPNAIWEVKPKPGRGLREDLLDRFGSFLAVLGISALLLADVLVTAVLSVLGQILPSSSMPDGLLLWWAVTFAVSWTFLTLAIALVYRILPDVKIAWATCGSGGLQRPSALARQSLDRLVFGRGRHRLSVRCSRIDRNRPVVGVLFLASRPICGGVHTGLRQAPRFTSESQRKRDVRRKEGDCLKPSVEPTKRLHYLVPHMS